MASFDDAIAMNDAGDGVLRWRIPEGWEQGAGAFGGLVVAALVRAMERTEEDATRRLRSITGDLCAPAIPGDAEIRVRTLRRGKGTTFLDAELTAVAATGAKAGGVIARASATLAASRELEPMSVGARSLRAPPVAAPWSDAAIYAMPPGGPAFAHHYEVRPVAGLPFTGAAEPLVSGWTREVVPLAALDAPAVAGRMDAWWPALFPAESKPRAAATVGFMLVFLADPRKLPAGEPFFRQGRVHAMNDGFFVEHREMWHGADLVATSQQTFAVLK